MPRSPQDEIQSSGIPLREIRAASDEQRLASFIEAMPVAVFVTDAKGSPCYSNSLSRELLGKGVESGAESKDLATVYQSYVAGSQQLYPTERMPLVRALDGVSCSVDDMEIQLPGKRVPLEVSGAPLFDASGHVAYAIAIFRDISQRRGMEARLRVADRMASVGTMAAGVAHEINNPLAYVMANLSFAVVELKKRNDLSTELLDALNEALEGSERVRSIVRDLKVFSHHEDQIRSAVDLKSVIESAINIAWNEIRHRATLVKLYGQPPLVTANGGRLSQVFLNLLVNAAQAIPEGAAQSNEIRVTTDTDASGRAVVEISDTGPGIAADHLARIFEPFFTTKAAGVGTGLGLAICHSIVLEHGGDLTVRSELGKGACFRVLLPAAVSAMVQPIGPLADNSVAAPLARLRLLVVDDEPRIGKSVARVLNDHFEVAHVGSAREALARLASREHFDLVITDLMMPEMTGIEFYHALLLSAPALAERMVFLTGGAFTESARSFLESVPNPRVEKPFDAQNLHAVIRTALKTALVANG